MSGAKILSDDVVMREVVQYLSSGDLESLKKSSELVQDPVQREIHLRRERQITVYLGVDIPNPMPLTLNTKVVNIVLMGGICNGELAWRQLMRIRGFVLNLKILEFTKEAVSAFENCEGIEIKELSVSSIALWDLQQQLKLDSIDKFVIEDMSDIYMPGLLLLLGNNTPTEMTIPADYLDYPQISRIIKNVTKMSLTTPRKHTMGDARIEKALGDISLTLTHLELRAPEIGDIFMYSTVTFPAVKYFSLTAGIIYLDTLPDPFPALETLELRNVSTIFYENTDEWLTNLKKLIFVLGDKKIKLRNEEPLDDIFPSLETIECTGIGYNSRSLDAIFKRITADKIIIRGEMFSYSPFYSMDWLHYIAETCNDLKIIPDLCDAEKIDWTCCKEVIKNIRNLKSLHIKNFKKVTPLNINKMLVEDSLIEEEFPWPGTCINSSVK